MISWSGLLETGVVRSGPKPTLYSSDSSSLNCPMAATIELSTSISCRSFAILVLQSSYIVTREAGELDGRARPGSYGVNIFEDYPLNTV
jgi:hypothetical protein